VQPDDGSTLADWNLFKQIFADHWDGFTHTHPRYQTAYYHDLVSKMLACGNPEKMGYSEYRCSSVARDPSGGDEL